MDPSADDESSGRSRHGSVATTSSLDSFSMTNNNSEDEGSSKLPIQAKIQSPCGKTMDGAVVRKQDGTVSVKFPREEVGTYVINLTDKKSGKKIPGSPYEVIVKSTDFPMNASGDGLKVAKVGETSCFTLSGRKGIEVNNLCIAVVGCSGIKLRVFQNDCDSIDIVYEVKRSGDYLFHVQENNKDIPGSPFAVNSVTRNTCANSADSDFIATLTATLWFGNETTRENLSIELKDPSGCYMAHAVVRRGRHLLEIRFLPNMNGHYILNVSFGLLRSHSFPINVTNFPEKKTIFNITGDGLHTAVIDRPTNIVIDSLLPITKSFSVEFDGPDKVNITQSRSTDGKIVIVYSGKSVGQYLMSIKYDSFHINGSPFRVIMTENDGQIAINQIKSTIGSNASLCRAYGPGLCEAISGKPNHFTVDALHAGSGSLTTGFDNNKHTPIEIVSKHVGNCVYDVHYKIDTAGFYQLSVLWGGVNIPGSPFNVKIIDPRKSIQC